ncbi:gypsy/ty3 retroelement polyprotein [Tanacetum coccineum]
MGHVITKEGVVTDKSKVEAMQQWLTPTNLKQLRGFLGLTGYYRRFVKNYAFISYPLTQLLKKNGFKWSKTAQAAFDQLKQVMTKASVLKLPDFNKLFILETDASYGGIGTVLQQGGHPVAHYSKTLAPRHHTLSTYEKELLAVIQALNNENMAADALSRIPTSAQLLTMALSTRSSDFVKKIMASCQADADLQKLVQDLGTNPQSHKHYTWVNGQLRRKGKGTCYSKENHMLVLLEEVETTSEGVCGNLQDVVDRTLAARESMIQLLQFHLERAQQRMKDVADAKRQVQQVESKVLWAFSSNSESGKVAYKLELPSSSLIHLVFHVSHLKKYKGSIPDSTHTLP